MNVELSDEMQAKDLNSSLCYSRLMGNSYTASIYIGLTSLLDSSEGDLSGSRVGLFSYGSGCVGEFFSGIIQPDYSKFLYTTEHQYMLEKRSALNYQQYEDMFNHEVPTDGGDYIFPQYKTGPFRLGGIKKHKRVYESIVS